MGGRGDVFKGVLESILGAGPGEGIQKERSFCGTIF